MTDLIATDVVSTLALPKLNASTTADIERLSERIVVAIDQ